MNKTLEKISKEEALRRSGLHSFDKPARLGSYAFFPGSGPSGKSCSSCGFFEPKPLTEGISEKQGKCGKYRELANQSPGWILPASPACKYYKAKVSKDG